MRLFELVLFLCFMFSWWENYAQSDTFLSIDTSSCEGVEEVMLVSGRNALLGILNNDVVNFELDENSLDYYRIQMKRDDGAYVVSDKKWMDMNTSLTLACSSDGVSIKFMSDGTKEINRIIDSLLLSWDQLYVFDEEETADSLIFVEISKNYNNGFGALLINNMIERYKHQPNKILNVKEFLFLSMMDSYGLNFESDLLNLYSDVVTISSKNVSFYDTKDRMVVNMPILDSGVVVVDWWHSRCPPCVKDHKLISDSNIVNKFNRLEAQFVSISVDFNKRDWLSYYQKNNYNWDSFWIIDSTYDHEADPLKLKLLTGFPTYQVLNDGILLYSTNFLAEAIRFVEELH